VGGGWGVGGGGGYTSGVGRVEDSCGGVEKLLANATKLGMNACGIADSCLRYLQSSTCTFKLTHSCHFHPDNVCTAGRALPPLFDWQAGELDNEPDNIMSILLSHPPVGGRE